MSGSHSLSSVANIGKLEKQTIVESVISLTGALKLEFFVVFYTKYNEIAELMRKVHGT